LARTLYGEAHDEPKEGIEAVANAIMRFPNTVAKSLPAKGSVFLLEPFRTQQEDHQEAQARRK
jgi:hypothetical protein